jgi:pimeloyl-ACP methyl ester carboxylesterase
MSLVLFVHGLGGDRVTTWGALPRWIFEDCSTFDVGLYGYTSGFQRLTRPGREPVSVLAEELADGIRDLEYGTVVLAGHSMGGLLCQAAVVGLLDSQVRAFGGEPALFKVRGLFLFGTPQAGTRRVPTMMTWFNSDARILRAHSEFVTKVQERLVDRFVLHQVGPGHDEGRFVLPTYAVIATRDRWVDSFSSRLGLPRENVRRVRGTHRSMVKPLTRNDDAYRWMLPRLVACVDKSHPVSRAGSVPVPVTGAASAPVQDVKSASALWRQFATADQEIGTRLFGVDDVVAEIAGRIENEVDDEIVSVGGAGGLGKTAVAFRAVETALRGGRFTRVGWAATATRFDFESGGPTGVGRLWSDVVKTLADQLNLPVGIAPAAWETQLAAAIRGLNHRERVLVVIDNLETVEDANQVVSRMRILGLTGRHCTVITTRHPLLTPPSSGVVNIGLRPLATTFCEALLRYEARAHEELLDIDESAIAALLSWLDGNPFLVKLVARRYVSSGLALDRIVEDLRATSDAERPTSAGVYDHLYLKSIGELHRICGMEYAERLLSAFCRYGATTAFTRDQLYRRSRIESGRDFDQTLSKACQLTLLRPFDQNRKYFMHGLLRDFRCRRKNVGPRGG